MTQKRRARTTKRLILTITGLVLLASYQNCSTQASYVGSQSLASSVSKGCDTPIASVFLQGYYPVMRSKCIGCHDNGEAGPARAFATANVSNAFDKFAGLGRAKVETMMLNGSHKPPFTGPVNQPLVDAMRPAFAAAEAQAAVCSGTLALTTVAKAGPATILTSATLPANAAAWPKLTWDLETEVADTKLNGLVHATFSIEVRRFVGAGATAAVGYEFKNPTVTIKAGSPDQAYRIETVGLNLNGADLATFTTYSLLKTVITGTAANNLAVKPNTISPAPTPSAPLASDTFAIRFGMIKATDEAAFTNIGGGGEGGGGGDATPDERITYADLMSSNQMKGIFSAQCQGCHNAARPAGSFDITTFANANGRRATIQARMNNVNLPMPPAGLLSFAQRKLVDTWISQGAPEK